MKIIPYAKHKIYKDDIKAVVDVLKSDWIIQGPKVKEFEESIAAYCGVKYAVAVSSGTAALHLSCLVIGLHKGDEIITTPITFLATVNSILYAGAKPVFADIDCNSGNISPGDIRERITKKTKAIIPVHFAGLPCDMPEISRIAKKKGLAVIEDACHALGAEYKSNGSWHKVGSCRHSDMTVFSFHPAKHITTGEGGIITTNNINIYKKLSALRSHGVYRNTNISKRKGLWYYEMRDLGFNYRITDFQCALGISQLKKLKMFINRRREIAGTYDKGLSFIGAIDLPPKYKNAKSSWHLYPIRLKGRYKIDDRRKKIFNYLRKKKIEVQVHYIPVSSQHYYLRLGYKKRACPNAEDFYSREISMPIFPALKNSEITYVINTLKDALVKHEE